ncbi:MAG: LLM class flavin-dependent oxidoreductase, partial [Chloroflexi bacterium]|nr:LLM class flavin-dependent oxidoreductase [Chloroflexota bacterium]
MITNFSASYAGHVVDDDLGFDGVAANDRRYPNEALAGVFDWALDIAQHLDRLGYDEFWMAEHHFQPEGYECIPNLLMLSLYLATKTERLKFGCGFNITPMWHPLRLAEDFAMADILTNGRVIFGVGRGYHSREVETFGSPMIDADANRELFEEQVEVILKAFTQESFSHQGKHFQIPARVPYRGYQLEKLSLVPRPTHQPVEVWQPLVSGSPRGIDFMAKMGIKPLIANNPEPVLGERIKMFQEASLAHGKELQLGEDVALGYRFFIADTQEKAMELAQPYFEEAMKFAAPLGLMRLTPEQIESVAQPGLRRGVALPTLQEAVDGGTWLCGPSEMLVEHL